MLRQRIWCSAWCVALIATLSVASAQQGQGGGRGRGFGGGGFGFGGPQGKLQLIAAEPVQKELALETAQVDKLKALGEEVRKESEALRGTVDFQGLRELPEEERNKKLAELREKGLEATRKVNEKFLPKLDEILNDGQKERLGQITLQVAGLTENLRNEDVSKKLNITPEQKEKLAGIAKTYRDKQAALGGQGQGGDFQQRFAQMRELNDARDKELKGVLTAEQTAELDKLLGKPFDVSQLRRGRGPGGPGGGPGGPGGRPAGRPQQDTKA